MREYREHINTQVPSEAKGFRAQNSLSRHLSLEGQTAQRACLDDQTVHRYNRSADDYVGNTSTYTVILYIFYSALENNPDVNLKYTSNLPSIYLSIYFKKEKLRGSRWGRAGEVGGSIGEVQGHYSTTSLNAKPMIFKGNDQGKGRRNLGEADITALKSPAARIAWQTDHPADHSLSSFFLFEKYILLIIIKQIQNRFKSLIVQRIRCNPVCCLYWLEKSEAWNELRKAEINLRNAVKIFLILLSMFSKLLINKELSHYQVYCYMEQYHPPIENSQEKLSTGFPTTRYKMASICKALLKYQYSHNVHYSIHIFSMNHVTILYIFKEGGPGGVKT